MEEKVKQGAALAALKRDIAIGISDLKNGRFQTYSEANLMQLAEEVGRKGRKRLAAKLD